MDDKSGYSAPPPPYNQAQGGYGPPQGGFAPPPAGYAPPPQGYAPPPQGYAPPPAGYSGQPQGYAPQGYAAPAQPITVTVGQPQPTSVVVVRGTGNCPQCRQGNIVEDFTVCGIVLAICFFPLGLICCLLMRKSYCNVCGYRIA